MHQADRAHTLLVSRMRSVRSVVPQSRLLSMPVLPAQPVHHGSLELGIDITLLIVHVNRVCQRVGALLPLAKRHMAVLQHGL